jgi:fatty-acyl-CoA synthase
VNTPLKAWLRALESTAPIERHQAPILPVLIDSLAERFNTAAALVAPGARLTYQSLAASMNQHARWALAQGLRKGDVVCLLMANSPEYMSIWLGLSRVGITVALLNTNLTGELLVRAIGVAAPRAVIVGPHFSGAIKAIRQRLPGTIHCWSYGEGDSRMPTLDATGLPAQRMPESEYPAPALTDRALYIYTSGTTGLPKAANVSHFRVMQWSHWFAGMMDTGPNDRMYNCLPMYHSIGGVVATGAVLVKGGAVILRERFSASEFWQDIVTERCTLFQYIGELCR